MVKDIVVIGSSSHNNKTVDIGPEFINNVYLVNKTNWASNDTYNDQFRVEICDGKAMCKRLDIDSGWGMHLMIHADVDPTRTTTAIPKILYQTWKTSNLGSGMQTLVDSWLKHNPQFRHMLYDDSMCEDFIKNNYSAEVLGAYKIISPGAFRADFWRYLVLYKTGGVYADIDTMCYSSILNFLQPGIDFVVPIDIPRNYGLFNAFIACTPNHPILKLCIDMIVKNTLQRRQFRYKLDYTGPGLLGKAVNIHLGRNETESFTTYGKFGNTSLCFLRFNSGIETVVDTNNNILFQNKNGSSDIQKIYDKESKSANIIHWYNTEPYVRTYR